MQPQSHLCNQEGSPLVSRLHPVNFVSDYYTLIQWYGKQMQHPYYHQIISDATTNLISHRRSQRILLKKKSGVGGGWGEEESLMTPPHPSHTHTHTHTHTQGSHKTTVAGQPQATHNTPSHQLTLRSVEGCYTLWGIQASLWQFWSRPAQQLDLLVVCLSSFQSPGSPHGAVGSCSQHHCTSSEVHGPEGLLHTCTI